MDSYNAQLEKVKKIKSTPGCSKHDVKAAIDKLNELRQQMEK